MNLVFAVLLYCLIGVLFLVCYILAMAPAKQSTVLGLIMLGWPVVIVLEFVFALANQFGKVGTVISHHLSKKAA